MRKILFLLLTLCLSLKAMATTVRFEPAEVSLGESVYLIFESDRNITAAPDISGLAGNFALSGQQQGSEVLLVNGRRRTKYTWTFTLFPRKIGELSTGEFTLNNEKLPSVTLKVSETQQGQALPMVLQTFTDVTTAYPEQLISLTARLIYKNALSDAKIMPPSIENARVSVLDKDRVYQMTVDGEVVNVIDRTYAVVPEKTGKLLIPPVEVYGTISTGGPLSPGDLFAQGMLFDGLVGTQKEMRLESKPIEITIMSKPDTWKGWWLPATDVRLEVRNLWSDQVSVGDSLTREVTLIAQGVMGDQLPVVSQPGTEILKVYPSPEQRTTIINDQGIVQGQESISIVMVPTKGGKITVPAIRLNWFNVQTQKAEVAIVPEMEIQVIGSSNGTSEESEEKTAESEEPLNGKRKSDQKKKQSVVETEVLPPQKLHFWIYWTAGLVGLALLSGLGLGYFLFRKHHPRSYLIVDKKEKNKKKKKESLPNLYPF